MSLLLVGDRADVLLVKYRLLQKNWRLDIQQCYSLDAAKDKLEQSNFDCLILSPFYWQSKKVQYQKLRELNQAFQVPIKVWQED